MGRKQEIWQTYLRYRRTRDTRLLEVLNTEYANKVIAQRDYDVVQTPRSNIYHRRSCSYLNRSRNFKRMKKSTAILNNQLSCTRCIREPLNPLICLFVFGFMAIVFIISWIITR